MNSKKDSNDKEAQTDVAGSLTNFAKKPLSNDFNEIRNQAWDQEIIDYDLKLIAISNSESS